MPYATSNRTTPRRGSRYRETEILSATPGELVVVVYDHLLSSLLRARTAIAARQVEDRIAEFGRARDTVAELLATLDRARGGEVAERLAALYAFFMRELAGLGVEPDVARLDRVIAMVRELREAFANIQPRGARP